MLRLNGLRRFECARPAQQQPYEATGEVDSKMETYADWQKENDTGVIYYLRDGMVRGVMMCNVWDKVEMARELIRKGERMTPKKLRGLFR